MSKLSMISDIWHFLRERKKYWLVPIVVVLLVLGAVVAFVGTSVVAPFIYTLF